MRSTLSEAAGRALASHVETTSAVAPAIPGLIVAAPFWTWLALSHHGTIWPDETYQSLEQAHRLAFGYGFVPWEYQVGARSWVFPAVLAAVVKASALIGADSAGAIVATAKTSMVVISLLALLATVRLAVRIGGRRCGVLAGLLGATLPAIVVFAGRCFSEVPSAAALGFAAAFVVGRRRLRLAGSLASLAILLRPQNALVAGGLLIWLVADRRRDDVRHFVQGSAAVLVAGGLLDWITLGRPFQSITTYLRYNLVDGRASDYGTASVGFYATALWTSTGAPLVALTVGLLWSATVARPLLAVFAAYVLVHSAIGHKELRFILPALPIGIALASVGLDRLVGKILAESLRSPRAQTLSLSALALIAAAMMAARAPRLTFSDIGRPTTEPGSADVVWKRYDSHNRLLLAASRAPDLCGLVVVGPPVIWLGGYSYLHRNVPLLDLSVEDFLAYGGQPAAWNYAILPATLVGRLVGSAVARPGGLVLVRVGDRCSAPPAASSRLFPLPEPRP